MVVELIPARSGNLLHVNEFLNSDFNVTAKEEHTEIGSENKERYQSET